MSRSGYTDDMDDLWGHIRWRGAVSSAIKGTRGQAFLKELLTVLDAMPEKRLVPNALEADGDFCTLGVIANARGVDPGFGNLDEYDWGNEERKKLADLLDISPALAAEIMYENDGETDGGWEWTEVEICGPMRTWEQRTHYARVDDPRADEKRWNRMRNWAANNIKKEAL